MMFNKTIDKMIRDKMKELLPLCTDEQRHMFNRMYSPNNLESPMDITVDGMKSDKLNHAMDQIERAIDSNQNFSLKS
mgnify:FL=1